MTWSLSIEQKLSEPFGRRHRAIAVYVTRRDCRCGNTVGLPFRPGSDRGPLVRATHSMPRHGHAGVHNDGPMGGQ